MVQEKIRFRSVMTAIILIAAVSGCTTVKQASKKSIGGIEMKGDYLGEGVVLAAFYAEDGGFSETRYYPAEILTSASEETNGEYQVVSHVGDFDVAEGDTHWTGNVILESHPADKEELKEGMIVLFTKKPREEGLEEARWNRGVVASTDELYKDMVQLDYVWYLDESDESDRQENVPIENIRIIDQPEI